MKPPPEQETADAEAPDTDPGSTQDSARDTEQDPAADGRFEARAVRNGPVRPDTGPGPVATPHAEVVGGRKPEKATVLAREQPVI